MRSSLQARKKEGNHLKEAAALVEEEEEVVRVE